jgi:hypothetical protein
MLAPAARCTAMTSPASGVIECFPKRGGDATSRFDFLLMVVFEVGFRKSAHIMVVFIVFGTVAIKQVTEVNNAGLLRTSEVAMR